MPAAAICAAAKARMSNPRTMIISLIYPYGYLLGHHNWPGSLGANTPGGMGLIVVTAPA